MDYIKRLYTGRINRLTFIVGFLLFNFTVAVLTEIFKMLEYSSLLGILHIIIILTAMIFLFSFYVRRLHDYDKSGWYTLVAFIPFVNIILFLFLVFVKSTKGKNQYGKVPRSKEHLFKDLFALKD